MNRPMHIAACSGGKDSVATILLAAQHGDPLDEVVFSEDVRPEHYRRSPGTSRLHL